jgi:hypothetical protein
MDVVDLPETKRGRRRQQDEPRPKRGALDMKIRFYDHDESNFSGVVSEIEYIAVDDKPVNQRTRGHIYTTGIVVVFRQVQTFFGK